MKYNISLVTLITVFITSCQVNTTYINREEDRVASQKVVDRFYNYLISQQPDSAMKLISRESNAINNLKLETIFSVAARELGKVEHIKFDSCRTKVVDGAKPNGGYLLYYTVIHEKYKTNDVFKLRLEDKVVKISDFRMNPSVK